MSGMNFDGVDKAAPREIEIVDDSAALKAIVAAEIDVSIATAHRFPRSVDRAKKKLYALVTLDEETAAECTYALPRGGKKLEGPSIRFAEAVAASWGNLRYGARVVAVGKTDLQAQGVAHDLESNAMVSIDVKRRITGKYGRFNDDLIVVTGNAACAVALRNAILKVVPKSYWRPLWQKSQEVARGTESTLGKKRGEWMAYLHGIGVDDSRIFAAIGVQGLEEIGLDEFDTLRKLAATVRNEEASVDTVFPEPGKGGKKRGAKTLKSGARKF